MVRVKGSGIAGLQNASALTKLLAKVTPPNKTKTKIDPRRPVPRVDVVSESLCDDVISYLAPTLEQHKGCTLIDLQPGACLFSSKLHDYLKPKCHLLMEQEDYYYKPFIRPLLDRPGSTYRYTQLNIRNQSSYWTEFERIRQDPNLLPTPPDLPDDDPVLRQLDPGTLIIGNLAREPRAKKSTHSVSLAPLMLYRMSYQALANQWLQKYGLVRMLLWVPEQHKSHVFSVLPWLRGGASLSLDMGVKLSQTVSVQSLEEVHQARAKTYKRRKRPSLLDDINTRDVAEEMRQAGLLVPPGRELQPMTAGLPPGAGRVQAVSPLIVKDKTLKSLQKKIKTVRARITAMKPLIRSFQFASEGIMETLEYPQASVVVEEYGNVYNPKIKWWRSTFLLDMALRVVNMEAHYKMLEESDLDQGILQELHGDLLKVDTEFTELCEIASHRTLNAMQELFDDQMAFFLSPRLLNVWERSYEPLEAKVSEFWPQQELALFDMVPKSRDLSVPGLANREECSRFCGELVKILFASSAQSLPQALDMIGVNAAKDLIPMVPAITDARRGGRLNPNNVRVRMVTEEMVEGIVKAFFEWPFRPQSWELALSDPVHEVDNLETAEREGEEAAVA